MNMIVAADGRWGIGQRGDLLVRIPYDQRCFREKTLGKVVVLGRRTLATFPQGLPLPGRTNVILSRSPNYHVRNALVAHSLEELRERLKPHPEEDVYVVGGRSVYRQLLPLCRTVHVTKIDHAYEADCFFPDLDQADEWEIREESDERTYFDIAYRFLRYERKDRRQAIPVR
ncbi:MAG: dihydrofolate reductase [Clostridium sp.]|jgi:dihydrofolate reductase|nr:dihydrofolate reductase [Clostridium sp.]